mmetsp:Transcript_5784/g.6335  ORF Transcript_5784/g.6335 Transcript_5784/m.6335 type:complete len:464 (-) Transcript_5784:65-1456(-)
MTTTMKLLLLTLMIFNCHGFSLFPRIESSLLKNVVVSQKTTIPKFNKINNNNLVLEEFGNAMKTAASVFCFSAAILFANDVQPSMAADYGSMSQEQTAVAEAWRLVDNSFIDRTFNDQNWFKLRQDNVKRKYKSMDDARGSITTMVGSLGDKYTRYLSPSKYQSLVDAATGNLCGVGVEISTNKDGRIIASDVEPNSPAQLAGIQPKDIFYEADGSRFDSLSTPDDVALNLRGAEGSRVGIVMERNGEKLDFIVTRKPIKISTVRSYMTTSPKVDKIGVIRIKSFSGNTVTAVKTELEDVKKKGAKAVVFDLRGNPGGLLPGGVDLASAFLEKDKPVVFVVNKNGVVDAQCTYETGIDLDTPVAIYVNSATASAAEVFTAAMQENGRATVIGEQTFGKGIVQTIKPLTNNNGGIAVTVAKYETPKRNSINKVGITVDIKTSVECPKDDISSCLPEDAFKQPVT